MLGYGIWDSFSTEAVQRRIQRHLTAVERWRSAQVGAGASHARGVTEGGADAPPGVVRKAPKRKC